MPFYTGGLKINPLANVVLAQTPGAPNTDPTPQDFRVKFSSTVGLPVAMEHMAADGTTVLYSFAFGAPAFGTINEDWLSLVVALGEFVRIRTLILIVGQAQAEIETGF
jgi:hypothetical protein